MHISISVYWIYSYCFTCSRMPLRRRTWRPWSCTCRPPTKRRLTSTPPKTSKTLAGKCYGDKGLIFFGSINSSGSGGICSRSEGKIGKEEGNPEKRNKMNATSNLHFFLHFAKHFAASDDHDHDILVSSLCLYSYTITMRFLSSHILHFPVLFCSVLFCKELITTTSASTLPMHMCSRSTSQPYGPSSMPNQIRIMSR